jgi:hypothetical protein
MMTLPILDTVITRLREHGFTVKCTDPASPEQLARLAAALPTVPDNLRAFWQHSDGLRICGGSRSLDYLEDLDSALDIRMGIESAFTLFARFVDEGMSDYGLDFALRGRLLPIRVLMDGNSDCLVVGPGEFEGAVVYWDRQVEGIASRLLASTFERYLDFWADALIGTYHPDGTPAGTHPWPMDEAWLRAHDPIAECWLGTPATRRWLTPWDDRPF